MRQVQFSLLLITISIIAYSQVPNAFNYQAVIRNSDGTVKENESVIIQINLNQKNLNGPSVYHEVHNTQSNDLGIVNLVIGEGTTTDNLSDVDWSDGPYFIEISLDGVLMGATQMLSVPYALYAASGNEGPQGEQGEPGEVNWEDDLVQDLLEEINYLNELAGTGTVTDIDGNSYRTIRIGTQVWMAENLNVTRYADGSALTLVEDDSSWNVMGLEAKAYCWYNNNSLNGDTYGTLYNWKAAMNGVVPLYLDSSDVQGVCPEGWHLPGDDEFATLEMFLGMSQAEADKREWRGTDEGNRLKATHGWNKAGNGTNISGFNALPAGYRTWQGFFTDMGDASNFWTTKFFKGETGYMRSLSWDQAKVYRFQWGQESGMSVRCVKNQ